MSASAESPLRKAVYDALLGNAPLVAAVTSRIYDDVPEGAAVPYVALGECIAVPFDTCDSAGQEHSFTLHVWSEYQGRKEVEEILALIYAVLHNGTLSVTGFQTILCQFDYSNVLKDPDGFTHHGVARYRVLTEDN